MKVFGSSNFHLQDPSVYPGHPDGGGGWWTRTSRALGWCGVGGAPGPDQQDASRVARQDVTITQEGQTLDELWFLIFLQQQQESHSVSQSISQSVSQSEGPSWSKFQSYPKDPLFAGQRVSGPGPKEDVGLPAGDDGVWVSGMELHSQDYLIGALKGMGTLSQSTGNQSRAEETGGDLHLDLSDLGLLLPVPHRQHVVIAVVHHAQVLARVLRGKHRRKPVSRAKATFHSSHDALG